jgi:hypothetical protein
MNDTTKLALLAVGVLGLAGGAYFMMHHSSAEQMRGELFMAIPPNERGQEFSDALKRMSYQELSDSLTLVKTVKAGRQVTDGQLIRRITAISEKYNIFT